MRFLLILLCVFAIQGEESGLTVAERLAGSDSAQIAWAAWEAAEAQDVAVIPLLETASRQLALRAAHTLNNRCLNICFDSLLRLGAQPSGDLLATMEQRGSLAIAVIWAAKEPLAAQSWIVPQVSAVPTYTNDPTCGALLNLCAGLGTREASSALVPEVQPRLTVTLVDNEDGALFGSRSGGGKKRRMGTSDPSLPPLPPVAVYKVFAGSVVKAQPLGKAMEAFSYTRLLEGELPPVEAPEKLENYDFRYRYRLLKWMINRADPEIPCEIPTFYVNIMITHEEGISPNRQIDEARLGLMSEWSYFARQLDDVGLRPLGFPPPLMLSLIDQRADKGNPLPPYRGHAWGSSEPFPFGEEGAVREGADGSAETAASENANEGEPTAPTKPAKGN